MAKFNQKKIRRKINALEAFGFISCMMFIGLLVTMKVSHGSPNIHSFKQAISVVGLFLLLSLLASPFTIIIYWILNIAFDLDDNIYDTAYDDGMRDALYPSKKD